MLFEIAHTATSTCHATPRQIVKLATVQAKLQSVFGTIEQGVDYPYASGGIWSTHDLIQYIAAQIGPYNLTMASWSVATHAMEKLIAWQQAGTLRSVNALFDWRVQVRTPGVLTLAKNKFNTIRISSCHAKVFVMQNTDWQISMVGSANLTNNPRIECGHLSTSPTIAQFHANWIMAEIKNAKPFGQDMRKAQTDGRK